MLFCGKEFQLWILSSLSSRNIKKHDMRFWFDFKCNHWKKKKIELKIEINSVTGRLSNFSNLNQNQMFHDLNLKYMNFEFFDGFFETKEFHPIPKVIFDCTKEIQIFRFLFLKSFWRWKLFQSSYGSCSNTTTIQIPFIFSQFFFRIIYILVKKTIAFTCSEKALLPTLCVLKSRMSYMKTRTYLPPRRGYKLLMVVLQFWLKKIFLIWINDMCDQQYFNAT